MHWVQTSIGYALPEAGAVLERRGRAWVLRVGTREIPLGRRASFDAAEHALVTAGAPGPWHSADVDPQRRTAP